MPEVALRGGVEENKADIQKNPRFFIGLAGLLFCPHLKQIKHKICFQDNLPEIQLQNLL